MLTLTGKNWTEGSYATCSDNSKWGVCPPGLTTVLSGGNAALSWSATNLNQKGVLTISTDGTDSVE